MKIHYVLDLYCIIFHQLSKSSISANKTTVIK